MVKKSLKRYLVVFQMDCSFQEKTDEGWVVWAENKKKARSLANLEKEARKINSGNGAVEYIIKSISLFRKK